MQFQKSIRTMSGRGGYSKEGTIYKEAYNIYNMILGE